MLGKLWPATKPHTLGLHPWKPWVICAGDGGTMHLLCIDDLKYGPIIVTAARRKKKLMVRCPACWQEHREPRVQLGNELTCPTRDCELRLKLNTFVIEPA